MKAKIIVLLLIFLSLSVQSPHWITQADEDEETIKVDATLVNIPVTVSDAQGRFIQGLKAEDFDLYEENVRQEITFFSNESMPFNVALVIDVSGSIRENVRPIQQAATAFINKLRPDDRVAIITFSKDLDLICDFTSNRDRLYRAIDNIQWGGSTRLYDAVYATMIDTLKEIDGRKAMILLTDGEDTRSRISADEAISASVEAGAINYVLQYPSDSGWGSQRNNRNNDPWGRRRRADRYPNSPFPQPRPRRDRDPGYPPYGQPPGQDYPPYEQPPGRGYPPYGGGRRYYQYPNYPAPRSAADDDFLQVLTEKTGGTVYSATMIDDLSGLASKIAEELRHVYVLGFYPTSPLEKGGYRNIKVRMARKTGMKLRYKTGYDAGNPNKQTRSF
jgi:Ca-activated chloride channel homolog